MDNSSVSSLNLQGQCFKEIREIGESIQHLLKVIRHTGNEVYCLECDVQHNIKSIGSTIKETAQLYEYKSITQEEFNSYYIPIKREVESTIEEAEFV